MENRQVEKQLKELAEQTEKILREDAAPMRLDRHEERIKILLKAFRQARKLE
jgi:methylmalonyl-CoA mutase cobalamin-binding subunit